MFVPLIRGSLDYARDDGTPLVISTKRSAWRNPLRRSSGYALNELMLSIMNWLCHEFSLHSMNCPKGHCGEKSIYFFVYHCSCQSLGDLSTTLEMTVPPLVISTKRSAWRNPLRRSKALLRVDTRVDINPLQDFRYTLKRSICATALDMP